MPIVGKVIVVTLAVLIVVYLVVSFGYHVERVTGHRWSALSASAYLISAPFLVVLITIIIVFIALAVIATSPIIAVKAVRDHLKRVDLEKGMIRYEGK